ncbi:MAG: valine--tRNA ligase, partial [Nanoarchaeota archaeon]|nr:valine--tRNA ligase [Nanoarchaeota archaeon]
KWLTYWEQEQLYTYHPDKKKKLFTIDTPPPTVSGHMHLGHAFSYAQEDFIARYKRMQGYNVFYPFGTDDNGLPTERLVEKMKNVKGINMPRPEFVKLCYDTITEIKPAFIQPWKNLGMSCDFKNTYSTIDEHTQKISQQAFIELYHQGKVYQQEAPTMWCIECQTAIAQADLKDKEKDSMFNDIQFNIGKEPLMIATTRPELLPACVALFTHPDDKRYKKYLGKHATVPLCNYDIPILSDPEVNPEKGTGIMMVCTFGDATDVKWWKQYKLPLRAIITKDGTLNELAGNYAGMHLKQARKKILEDLKTQGLLKNQQNIKHTTNVHERCDTPIEFLKTKQWFTRILDNKEAWLEAGNKITWYPTFMKKRYEHWVEGLQWDWCISRQRFFGIPFPLWYCKKCGEIQLADIKDLPIDPLKDQPNKKCHCGSKEYEPEKDVMDTWATSSVTPQIALSKNNITLEKPMDLRPQGQDIITTWAFYTIVKSLYLTKNIPWNNIAVSGYVVDPQGEKMSKSKGNVIDPVAIMEKFSADSLRYWAAGSKLGEDMSYQEKDLITGQKTVTKLWNAGLFSLQHLEGYQGEQPKKLSIMDEWLLEKLNTTIKECTDYFENYEYAKAKFAIDQFFWTTYCDNYLEIVKDRIYNTARTKEEKQSAQYTLHTALHTILKLFAPFLPYITEELYHQRFAKEEKQKSIHQSEWPMINNNIAPQTPHTSVGDQFIVLLNSVRKYKAQNKLSMKTPVTILLTPGQTKTFKETIKDLQAVTNANVKEKSQFKIVPAYEEE